MPIIVEFFGMPGSGKTFIAKHLIDCLRQEGFRVSDRAVVLSQERSWKRVLGKIGLVIRGLLFGNGILRSVLAIVSNYEIAGLGTKIKLVFNWLYLCTLIRDDSKHSEYIILDQGLGQALWSTLYYGKRRLEVQTVEEFFSDLPEKLPIDLLHIVHVQAHERKVEMRLGNRKDGKSPLDRDIDGAWQHAVLVTAEARSILDQLSECLLGILVTDVSNNDDGMNLAELKRIREVIV